MFVCIKMLITFKKLPCFWKNNLKALFEMFLAIELPFFFLTTIRGISKTKSIHKDITLIAAEVMTPFSFYG